MHLILNASKVFSYCRYLEHIKSDNALLSWDDTASEHFVSVGWVAV